MQALIIGALETGCRVGELLSLRWEMVDLKRGLTLLDTKTGKDRRVPITARLRAVLLQRRHGIDGKEHPAHAFVFGRA